MKRIFAKNTKDIIIVICGVLGIWLSLQVSLGTPNPFYVVVSDSMVPTLNKYDVLVIQGNLAFAEVHKDDIIVFDSPSKDNKIIVHRVESILDQEPLILKTKGDANPYSIPGIDFPITKDEYRGKVLFVIPQIGIITQILQPPINYVVIGLIIGILIIKNMKIKNKTSCCTKS